MKPSSQDLPIQGNASRDLKLAGVVHDLNNVFQTLIEVADLLTYESVDPNGAKLSAAILRSVERGKRITEALVADGLAKGTASLDARAASSGNPLAQVLSNAMAFVEDTQISGRGPAMRVVCDLEPGILLDGARSDGWAWERVFINLFMNSLRAMPNGGTVFVSARRAGPVVEIRVRDEGPGIALELVDCLFEPHVSGSASTGLGLHIVKTIVESEGGTVQAVRQTEHPGAEFLIVAPLAQVLAQVSAAVEAADTTLVRPAHA